MADNYDESIDMMSGSESETYSSYTHDHPPPTPFIMQQRQQQQAQTLQDSTVRPTTTSSQMKFNNVGGNQPAACSNDHGRSKPHFLEKDIKKLVQTQKPFQFGNMQKLSNRGQLVDSEEDDDEDYSLMDETNNLSSFMDDDDYEQNGGGGDGDDDDLLSSIDPGFLYPIHDYGTLIDAVVEDVPSPFQAFPIPPIHDEAAMADYLKLKEIWELKLDIKRDRLCEFVTKNCIQPGIHKSEYYKREDYSHLKVPREVSLLFSHIKPSVEPFPQETKMSPYIPDYYPSVGDIDAFIKVTEPTLSTPSTSSYIKGIGINSLDEPSSTQSSDPSLLELQLRSLAKIRSAKAVTIKSLENASEHPELVEKWVKDITDLHRSKPSPSVHYSKPMPDIDSLLQEWPLEMEDMMKCFKLPEPDLNCDLGEYVDIVCGLLDIPVYKSRIQSLHILFSLYASVQELNNGWLTDSLSRNKTGSSERKQRGDGDNEVDILRIN